jgi:hypothetical protein
MMEAINTYETSVNVYQITLCNFPEDSHLQSMDGWMKIELTVDESTYCMCGWLESSYKQMHVGDI